MVTITSPDVVNISKCILDGMQASSMRRILGVKLKVAFRIGYALHLVLVTRDP